MPLLCTGRSLLHSRRCGAGGTRTQGHLAIQGLSQNSNCPQRPGRSMSGLLEHGVSSHELAKVRLLGFVSITDSK